MRLLHRARRSLLIAVLGLGLSSLSAFSQQKPAVTIDLKPLGAAEDLFADPNESKREQRSIIDLFWVGDDRLAVGFSSNRRWTSSDKPEPLEIRLVVFNRSGKQLNERNWTIGAEGPSADNTLRLLPGPDGSILAIHDSFTEGPGDSKIPEGNFVQVLNPDLSQRQTFYIPSTAAYVPGNSTEPGLTLQTFYADKHSSVTWWSGKPLKPELKLELSKGSEPVLAGPKVAAQLVCATPSVCQIVRVFRSGAAPWSYKAPLPQFRPLPLMFLGPAALLIKLGFADMQDGQLIVIHPDGSFIKLPALSDNDLISDVSSAAANGNRFAVDSRQQVSKCGVLDFWCKERGDVMVFDVSANRMIFEQEISAYGAVSAISPDGHAVAILDRNKLAIYSLP